MSNRIKEPPVRYVISVLISDRVGILRDITSAVADLDANIDGISQTVVAGYFTVILTATFPRKPTADTIRHAIEANFGTGEASVVVRPYRAPRSNTRAVESAPHVVTLSGKDRPGILKAVTAFLASRGVNIEDWFVQFQGPNVTHIGEVTVPDQLDIQQLQSELRQIASQLGLSSGIQHENIFRVTNEVGPISTFLGD